MTLYSANAFAFPSSSSVSRYNPMVPSLPCHGRPFTAEPDSKKRKSKPKRWDGNIQGLILLGNGVSGAVFAIDDKRVAKIDLGSLRSIEDIETERMAYYNLSKGHLNVLSCLDIDNPNGLVFERCQETIRSRLRSRHRDTPPRAEVVKKWAYQAAKGLAFVHECGIIQVDGQIPRI
jgi:hypothetical protein